MALYLALLVNGISTERNFGGVYAPEDLRGKAVMTVDLYESLMTTTYKTSTGLYSVDLSTSEMEQFFMNSKYDYLATDDPALQLIATTNCKVGIALENFIKLTFGLMLNKNVDPEILREINRGIIYARSKTMQSARFANYFAEENFPMCTNRPAVGAESYKIADMEAPLLFLAGGSGLALILYLVKMVYKFWLLSYKGKVYIEGVRSGQESELMSKVRIISALYLYVSFRNISLLKRRVFDFSRTLRLCLGDKFYPRGQVLGKQIKVVNLIKQNAFFSIPSRKKQSKARSNFRKLVKRVILIKHYKISVEILNKFSGPKPKFKPRHSFSGLQISIFGSKSQKPRLKDKGLQLQARGNSHMSWLTTRGLEETKTLFVEFVQKIPKLLTKQTESSWWDRTSKPNMHRVEFRNGSVSEPIIIENQILRNLQEHLQKYPNALYTVLQSEE
eukprot:TRINITY_DN5286_c0_g1_i1.p1 TRINITY_DN5286_c0_g1~~TRINITY_DN5286_c0_g1_i1.p1  ORF type:complete len:446 (+),score=70.56 TRINITY_DN5286_c0_g1_i1:767-2104(+)